MPKLITQTEVHLDPQGRLVIPAPLRHSLGFESGDSLIARTEDGRLILEKAETIKQRLKTKPLPPHPFLRSPMQFKSTRSAAHWMRSCTRGWRDTWQVCAALDRFACGLPGAHPGVHETSTPRAGRISGGGLGKDDAGGSRHGQGVGRDQRLASRRFSGGWSDRPPD